MSSITVKFLVPVAALVTACSALGLYWNCTATRDELVAAMDGKVSLALAFDLAIREYVAEKIRPVMEERTAPDEFIPETMSTSFVARSIFEKVLRGFPDLVIKFSSDNPRNPANQAGPDELRMIRYFNEHPEVDTWAGEMELNGQTHLARFAARRMQEKCLRCHGRPEDAPAAIVERYGSQAGFHRPLGEVVALDTVAAPMDRVGAAAAADMTGHIAIGGISLAVLLLAIVALFQLLVGRRLGAIRTRFEQIAAQPASPTMTPVEARGSDEIAALARSFNAMVEKVRAGHDSLEEQVVQRTQELAAQVGKLERFNRVALGREQRIMELKHEVNSLLQRTGEAQKYTRLSSGADLDTRCAAQPECLGGPSCGTEQGVRSGRGAGAAPG